MFGMGMPEILLILAIALIVIGPSKLPELAKSLGRAMGEFRRATNEIKDSIDYGSQMDSLKKNYEEMNREFKDSMDSVKDVVDDAVHPEKANTTDPLSGSHPNDPESFDPDPDMKEEDAKDIPEDDAAGR